MKSIRQFITESANIQKMHDLLYDTLFVGTKEAEEDDELEKLEDIVNNFLKDAKSIKIESSVAEKYWDIPEIKQNNKVENEVKGIEDDCDWQLMDLFSLKVNGNVMLMSSNTNSSHNGDYYDGKVTKTV